MMVVVVVVMYHDEEASLGLEEEPSLKAVEATPVAEAAEEGLEVAGTSRPKLTGAEATVGRNDLPLNTIVT